LVRKDNMTRLTEIQKQAIERIRIIRDLQIRSIKEFVGEHVIPNQYVARYALVHHHHMRRDTIDQLIRKGYLVERSSDVNGSEVGIASE